MRITDIERENVSDYGTDIDVGVEADGSTFRVSAFYGVEESLRGTADAAGSWEGLMSVQVWSLDADCEAWLDTQPDRGRAIDAIADAIADALDED